MPLQNRLSKQRKNLRDRLNRWSRYCVVSLVAISLGLGFVALQVWGNELPGQELPGQELPRQDSNAQSSNTVWLAKHGVESSVDSFRLYFENLIRDDIDPKIINDLVVLLSADDFQVREKATNSLKTLPTLRLVQLERLSRDSSLSPEGKYRLLEVIRTKQRQAPGQIQYAIFCEIRDQNLSGLADAIIRSFEALEADRFVRHAAIQALIATSQRSDLEQLGSSLADTRLSNQIRVGALRSINSLSPETAVEQVLETTAMLWSDADGELGLEVARVLVMNRRIQAFDVLCRLLADEKSDVRGAAFATLVRMTAIDFGPDGFAEVERAENISEQVTDWLDKNADEINYQWYHANPRMGRRLICQYDADRVIELDESGKVVWSTEAEKPFACLGLPNGHRFILLYTERAIVEYDGAGRVVRRLEGLPSNISSIFRRENGNLILAAGQNENLIVEIDADGNQVNSFKVNGKPTSAEIGINGNLVVALYGLRRIVEIDSRGETVRTIHLDAAPYHVTPLVSGNYLVAFAQDRRIVEYDQRGNEVYRIDCKQYSYHAQKLDDGTVSFADETGVFRFDDKGREIEGQTYRSVGKVNYMYSY